MKNYINYNFEYDCSITIKVAVHLNDEIDLENDVLFMIVSLFGFKVVQIIVGQEKMCLSNRKTTVINYTDPAWLSLTNERKFVD